MKAQPVHAGAAPVETEENVIRIRDLRKSFGANHVLKGVDLDLKKGENLVVLGKSGSGKSVLIKCIIGLLRPDAGVLEVFGKSVTELNQQELDEMRVHIGFLFQSAALYDSMTVRENLEFPLRRHLGEMPKTELDKVIHETLSNVGLAHTENLMPSELSGGMRKRIGVARSMILKPDIMLYDEPTTGLDPITSREISELILTVQERYQTSSIIITHDMACAKITANRMLVLVEGVIQAIGTYDELSRSSDPLIQSFFD